MKINLPTIGNVRLDDLKSNWYRHRLNTRREIDNNWIKLDLIKTHVDAIISCFYWNFTDRITTDQWSRNPNSWNGVFHVWKCRWNSRPQSVRCRFFLITGVIFRFFRCAGFFRNFCRTLIDIWVIADFKLFFFFGSFVRYVFYCSPCLCRARRLWLVKVEMFRFFCVHVWIYILSRWY